MVVSKVRHLYVAVAEGCFIEIAGILKQGWRAQPNLARHL
jgi:hypothetical protein